MADERASELFGCGIVAMPEPAAPDPWHEGRVSTSWCRSSCSSRPTEFVLLREGVPDVDEEPLIEAGRFPRAAFVDATVVDAAGRTVPEPTEETFEPSRPVLLVVRWEDGGRDRRGPLRVPVRLGGGEAARRFRRAAVGSG